MIDNITYKSIIHENIVDMISRWREFHNQSDLDKIQIWSYFKIREFFIKRCLHDHRFKPSDIEILIEKAYLRFVKHHEKVKKPESFPAWLKTVCSYSLFEFVKLKKNMSESLSENLPDNSSLVTDDILREVENRESELRLTEKIKKLMTPSEAEVVIKKVFENKTNAVIAAELRINEQTVKNLYYRGSEKLRNSSYFNDLLRDKTSQFY